MVLRMRLSYLCCCQREVGLSKCDPDISAGEGDGCEGASPHRSYQTAQQQVSHPAGLKTLQLGVKVHFKRIQKPI